MEFPGRGVQLSRREREVAALVAEGLTDQEIADRLFLSRRTAEGHVQAIRNKLGLDNRSQVAAWYARQPAAGETAGGPAAAPRLPVQLTSFIGRERELDGIRQALRRARGVTIVGPGGAGKTRLAIRLAEELAPRHGGGTWFVDLAPVSDPAGVLPAVAAAIGVREGPGGELADSVADRLGAGPRAPAALLVLDNCEQVIDATAAAATQLLRACPSLVLVSTSREPLLFEGEVVWKLTPLEVPETGEPTAASVSRFDAAQLLCDRAALSDPDFALRDENAGAVAELCRRLDGIPLALELAAAQVGPLGLDGVLGRLGERLDFLLRRAGPERHQTLTAAMRWSYDLLSEPERTLFRRLAVFRGSFPEAAVESVCGQVAAQLPALAAKSLVAPSGLQRWAMLETIRGFAAEMLALSGEAAAAHDRHLAHFLGLAERAEAEMAAGARDAWLAAVEADHDNFTAALEEAADPASRLGLVVCLFRFWLQRGLLSEGRAQLEAALALDGRPSALRARALNGLAGIAWRQGDYDRARACLEECVQTWRGLGEPDRLQPVLANLGVLAAGQGDYAAARMHYTESLALAEAAGSAHAVAVLKSNLGLAGAELGDHAQASRLLAESLEALRDLDDRAALGSTLVNLGLAALHRDRPAEARSHFEAALAELAAVGDTPDAASCLEGLGWVAAREERTEHAVRLAGAAAAIREAIGAPASPAARARLARWLPAARDALGAGADAAWEAGRALAPAAAIELGRSVPA